MTLPTAVRTSVVAGCVAISACGTSLSQSAPTAPAEAGTHAAPESFAEFRDRLETAALAIMNGDSRSWEELYSHAPDATLFGGWGGHEKGWAELAPRWQMVRGRYREGTFRIDRISEHITDDLAVTVEIWRGDAAFSDGSSGPIGLRITHVCRREQGHWRLVHRHADTQLRLLPIQSHIQPPEAT